MIKGYLYYYGQGEDDKKLLKRPVKNEITNSIWETIEKRLTAKHKVSESLSYGNACCYVDDDFYVRSGFIKETDEYNCDDIATAILKYSKKNNVIIPFGLTIGKNNNVAIYKKQ